MKKCRRWILLSICAFMLSIGHVMAGVNQFEPVRPNQWDYKALMHFAQQGLAHVPEDIVLGQTSYSRYELMPMVAEIVEQEKMLAGNDQKLAKQLKSYYQEDLELYYLRSGSQGRGPITK